MDPAGPTLQERALRTYRRLLVLERVFLRTGGLPREPESSEADAELHAGVRELLTELAEEARILSTVPVPLSEWRQGDGPNDGRWRTISLLERREVRNAETSRAMWTFYLR